MTVTTELRLLPESLRGQAQAFLELLDMMPKQGPSHCPHCGTAASTAIVEAAKPSVRLPTYRCRGCNKAYNALTRTPLARMRRMEIWRSFAEQMLNGSSHATLSKTFRLSGAAVRDWKSRLRTLMLERFPDLARWWVAQEDTHDSGPPDHLRAARDEFLAWLEALYQRQDAPCPYCGGSGKLKQQFAGGRAPAMQCLSCARQYNALTGTPFTRLQVVGQWSELARMLLDGATNVEIERHFKIAAPTAAHWRQHFYDAIAEHSPLLGEWVRWQYMHRHREAVKQRPAAAAPD